MEIAVAGSGYVGLVTRACFTDLGVDVTCIDTDEAKIGRLQQGDVPIYEPGLADLMRQPMLGGRLKFTTDIRIRFMNELANLADAVGANIRIGAHWNRIRQSHRAQRPLVFDGRNLYAPYAMPDANFEYHAIGRSTPR